MTIKSFLKLVEIQTKVASIIPFLLGTFYALYRFGAFNTKNFLLMLVSLLCIDMATTAINNYLDFKRANKKHGYGYESHNAIVSYKLKEGSVLAAILTLLALAMVFGFLLYMNTNIVVLILGAASFMVGVLYSFGPIPISRTPFGELFSGGFMGFIIPFLAVYIHVFDKNILTIGVKSSIFNIGLNMPELLYIILLSVPAAAGIANIMLANNICDIEDDIENKRYTMPIYVGKTNALKVFAALYYIGYAALLALLVMGIMPLYFAVTLLTFIVVQKNINTFNKLQSKKDTFVLSVKNFVLSNAATVAVTAAAAAVNRFF